MTATIRFKAYLLRKGYSKTTIASYLSRVNRFQHWLAKNKMEHTNTQYADIIRYIEHLNTEGLKPASIQSELVAINHFFLCLIAQEIMTNNPVTQINLQGSKRKELDTLLSPEQLEDLYQRYHTERQYDREVPPQLQQTLSRKRNKVILGLMAFQGLTTTDLHQLKVTDVIIGQGSIAVSGSRKYAYRKLPLQAQQVPAILEYLQQTRKQLLCISGKESQHLFFSTRQGQTLHNSLQKLIANLKLQLPALKNAKQIRTSVIVHWLKKQGLRKTQYLAGHKYISATEAYQVYCTEQLSEDINRFHPLS